MNLKYFCYLLLLAAIWGSSFSFIKVASPDFGAFPLAFTRIFLAALFLMVVVIILGRGKSCFHLLISKQYRIHLLVSGLFGQLLPFILYGEAELTINASSASILNATTPFWTAIIAFVWLKKRFTKIQIFGMILGFIGVAVLINSPITSASNISISNKDDQILSAISILIATLCYGFGGNYLQHFLKNVHSLEVATASTIYAAIIGLPFAIYFWPDNPISIDSWKAMLLLGILCTGFAFILFFDIVAKLDANFAVSVTFLIPIFGVFWAVYYLEENINITMITSMIIVLLGVILSNFKKRPS